MVNTKIFGESDKPYLVKWSIINSVIIFAQSIHLKLLNRRDQALCDRILLGAIFSAQMNNEGLKSKQVVDKIFFQQQEMEFDPQ
jgi:hypothetical protein